jgi:hypothetical protein
MTRTLLNGMWHVVENQQGSEIVEWVLWIGGLAMVAIAIYGSIAAGLTTMVAGIFD